MRTDQIDQLTGLYSRWHCTRELEKIVEVGEPRVIVTIDMKGFRNFNHKYGSNKGDLLLQAIAKALRASFANGYLSRLSADKFAVILPPVVFNRHEMSLHTHLLYNNLHKISIEGLENERYTFSVSALVFDSKIHSCADDILQEVSAGRLKAKKHEGNFLWSKIGEIPDVEGCFISLRDDRNLYNNINNSLSAIHDENDWMLYLKNSSEIKENMCRRNQGRIDDILNYYKQGDLPEIDYELLYNLVCNYINWLDAFMQGVLIDNILIPYYEAQVKTEEVCTYLGYLYLLLGDSLVSVFRIGDFSQGSRVNALFKKSCEYTRYLRSEDIQFGPYLLSLCEMVSHYEDIDEDFCPIAECDAVYEELRQLIIGNDELISKHTSQMDHLSYLIANARLFPLYRASYLLIAKPDLTIKERSEITDRIEYIKAHLDNEGVYDMAGSDPTLRNASLFLQGILFNNLSKNEVIYRIQDMLHKIHIQTVDYSNISDSYIVFVAYLFYAASHALDQSELAFDEKHIIAISGVNFLIEILRKRESHATDHQILFLTQVLMQAMLANQVLATAEKYHYLNQAMAAIMIDTYGHSRAVATYANLILTNIIDNYPHILVGEDKLYASVEDLKANRTALLKFMQCGCMLHDLGKMTITPISSNAYRRLTDKEFSLIKSHPQLGVMLLSFDTTFEDFYPFILMHHRWCNGQAGYPEEAFPAKYARYKVLVDILSICDSLEAATSHVGRNYRNAKTFLQILDEFYEETAARYNKEIIQSIISHPDTYYAIRQMADNNWKNVYQGIFQELFTNEWNHETEIKEIPDIFANSDRESVCKQKLALKDRIDIPEWFNELDEDTRLLYTCSLMSNTRMDTEENNSVFFYYMVLSDTIIFQYRDPQDPKQVHTKVANHYSNKRLNVVLSQDGYDQAMAIIKRVITEPDYPKEGKYKLEHAEKNCCLLTTYSSILDNEGNVLTIMGRLEDINTSNDKVLQTIQRQNQYIEIFNSICNSYVATIYSDADFNHYEIFKGYPALLDNAEKLPTTNDLIRFAIESIVEPEFQQGYYEFVDRDRVLERLKTRPQISYDYKSKLTGWLRATILPAKFDSQLNITHLLYITERVNDDNMELESLIYAEHFDSLTGLLNRTYGENEVTRLIGNNQGCQVFAVLDCDNLSQINAKLSHLVGDEVLRRQSKVLKEYCSDTTLVRLGGDEFLVYVHGDKAENLINSSGGLKEYFHGLAEQLATVLLTELENVAPTMSIGVVYTYQSVKNMSFDELYQYAEEALNHSKKHKNGVVTFNSIINHQLYN